MTGVRLAKPWLNLDEAAIAALPGQLGVYEIADANGGTLELGFAGGRSRFGLRSAIAEAAAKHEAAARFRYEVTMQYLEPLRGTARRVPRRPRRAAARKRGSRRAAGRKVGCGSHRRPGAVTSWTSSSVPNRS